MRDVLASAPAGGCGPYGEEYSRFYDLFYEDKPYAAEAAFVDRCFRRYRSPNVARILDLACGTGGHTRVFESLGYEVLGIDASEAMLSIARSRGREAGLDARFICQDMTELDLEGARFDAVVCLFDSIGYARSDERIAQAFDRVHRHLRPDGLLVLEFWHEPAMLHAEPLRLRRWRMPDGELMRISETTLQEENRTATVHYTVVEMKSNGQCHSSEETHVNRYFSVDGMARLLTSARLIPVAWTGGFADHDPITDDTWHVVVVARRA